MGADDDNDCPEHAWVRVVRIMSMWAGASEEHTCRRCGAISLVVTEPHGHV